MEAHNLFEYERVDFDAGLVYRAKNDSARIRKRNLTERRMALSNKRVRKSLYKNETCICRGKLRSHFGENGIEIIVNGYHLSFAITPKFENA